MGTELGLKRRRLLMPVLRSRRSQHPTCCTDTLRSGQRGTVASDESPDSAASKIAANSAAIEYARRDSNQYPNLAEKLGESKGLVDGSAAKSGAVLPNFSSLVPELAHVIDRWPSLSPATQQAIVHLAQSNFE